MPKIDLSDSSVKRMPDYFSTEVVGGRRFFAGRRAGGRGVPHVVAAGVEKVAANYAIDRKTFPCIGIEFVAAGEGSLNLRGKPYVLQAGVAFCYGPRTSHRITTHANNRLVKYFADFEGSAAMRISGRSGFAPGDVLQTSQPGAVMSIFDELIRAGLSPQRFSEDVCGHLLSALLYRIAETAVPPESFRTSAFSSFASIRADLEQHALEIPSLGMLAERNHMDEAYLCRLFKRFDFESPYRKLQRLKMQHAAQRLQQGDALIKQVAREMGFSDPFHFSRSFKRVLGISPSQLLRNRS